MCTECVDIQSAVVDADIRLYIEDQLNKDRVLKEPPMQVMEKIMEALMKDAKRMYDNIAPIRSMQAQLILERFRWVTCQIDVLRNCDSPAEIAQILSRITRLTKGFYKVYQQIAATTP